MTKTVQLITYVDRLGKNFSGLGSILNEELSGLFGGVHILPFFDPIDGADAGFDPANHTAVDSRLGDWNDVRNLSKQTDLMADLIINHISSDSEQFQDVLKNDEHSKYWDLFLKKEDVFQNNGTQEELGKILRLHPNAPFLPITLDNGKTYNFWSTFSDKQLDINVETEIGQKYLTGILDSFADAGIKYVRLDAVGFAIKRRSTSCFMLPETFEFIESFNKLAAARGMQVLVEVHSYYKTQIEIAKKVSWVYDFALPGLVLHTLFSGNAAALKKWLEISPRNCITVLDTHDGIGVIDAGPEEDKPGLLSEDDIQSLIEQVHSNTKGQSKAASGEAAENLDVSQLNTTYFDALGRSDRQYLLARCIQLFCPGIPQIYYVGLLAGHNDMQLLEKTGNGRDINRQYFSRADIQQSLDKPVVESLFGLIRLRNSASGFNGEFELLDCSDQSLQIKWTHQQSTIELKLDLVNMSAAIVQNENGIVTEYSINDQLERDHEQRADAKQS
ncbi:MAG: sucrose phosphorylase [Gammaproteobacteria bacterium]|nr:sucrose phosphorylase [Gammaproteobacteria bacterium]NNM13656.1 sucrose phosphorylase [Gammaproteobacteria bacterium]